MPALKECEQHQLHLQSAWREAIDYPAFQQNSPDLSLNAAQIRTLDQLLFRFGKLQDAISTRLLPALLQILQEWQDNEAFLDKLNRAEKIGLIPSVEQWQNLREIRNQTTHEYPDNPELTLIGLRKLVENVPVLLALYLQLKTTAETRGLLVAP